MYRTPSLTSIRLGGITYGNYCADFVDTWNVSVSDVPSISRTL